MRNKKYGIKLPWRKYYGLFTLEGLNTFCHGIHDIIIYTLKDTFIPFLCIFLKHKVYTCGPTPGPVIWGCYRCHEILGNDNDIIKMDVNFLNFSEKRRLLNYFEMKSKCLT